MQGRGEKWEASNEVTVIGTVRKRREIENQKKKREEENMSLKNNKYARRLAAALMTGAMMVSMMGMTAFAQNGGETKKPEFATETKITKHLELGENVYAPTATFSFTIAAADADTVGEKGIAAAITSNKTISVAYTPADGMLDEAGEIAKTTADAFKFDASEFGKPGIYHYTVTEDTTTTYPGMTYDRDHVKDLYVYVENTNPDAPDGNLKIAACVLRDEATAEEKTDGFTNTYNKTSGLKMLTVTKKVTGAQGNKNADFEFTILIGNEDQRGQEKYHVVITTFNENGEKVTTIDTFEKGVADTFTLSDGEKVEIYGLSDDDTYTITEDSGDAAGYTTKKKKKSANKDNEDRTVTSNVGQDTTVTFENNKGTGLPETGVILNIAPYILMVALAGVLAFFFLRKRHYEM